MIDTDPRLRDELERLGSYPRARTGVSWQHAAFESRSDPRLREFDQNELVT
jgi:hypothetical protein